MCDKPAREEIQQGQMKIPNTIGFFFSFYTFGFCQKTRRTVFSNDRKSSCPPRRLPPIRAFGDFQVNVYKLTKQRRKI
jgi:hypothetical protein